MTTNPDKLAQAREWAKYGKPGHQPETVAAAEVINALPDTIVDGEKLRGFIHMHQEELFQRNLLDPLNSLLPAPTPRTLADLSEEERHAHVWKDVHVEGWDSPSMLVAVYKDEGAVLGHNWIQPWPFVEVRPLADLTPRRASFSNEGVETGNENRNEGVETGNDHPVTLSSVEDYESAPTGTVVAGDYADPWVKDYMGFWLACSAGESETSQEMALAARRVLRRGEIL